MTMLTPVLGITQAATAHADYLLSWLSCSLYCEHSVVLCRTAESVHVGPAGVLALPLHVTRPILQAMLAEARDFVAEWQEMRPVFQHRLFGQCLRPPLQVQQDLQSDTPHVSMFFVCIQALGWTSYHPPPLNC